MDPRYTLPEMKNLWSYPTKYRGWLRVELAILEARQRLGLLQQGDYEMISKTARVNVRRIAELDAVMDHDMNAAVECAKEYMRKAQVIEKVVALYHDKPTSYDIEDAALSLRLMKSIDLIIIKLQGLLQAIRERAVEFKYTPMMGVTHNQPAETITLGFKLLNFSDIVERDIVRVSNKKEIVAVGKMSGIVGMYGDLSPEIETEACQILGLMPVRIATQIIHRDRYVEYMQSLALLATNLAHIANTLWMMTGYGRREASEPFGKGRRGSSRAPHKRNPFHEERIRGQASIVRNNVNTVVESVLTPDERAIDQSCVERVLYPDITTLVHYMADDLTKIVAGMQFYPDKMAENITSILGLHASGYVKTKLNESGIGTMTYHNPDGASEDLKVYEWVQRCAFTAWEEQKHFQEVLILQGVFDAVTSTQLAECFDPAYHTRYVNEIFARFGL